MIILVKLIHKHLEKFGYITYSYLNKINNEILNKKYFTLKYKIFGFSIESSRNDSLHLNIYNFANF